MPSEKILDLLDQAQKLGFQGDVTFYFYSELLLDKRNLMFAEQSKKRNMNPYIYTNGDLMKHDNLLCLDIKDVYDYIVLGLYDYKTNDELEEDKLYWHDRLAGADIKFSTIGLLGAKAAHSMAIPRALVPSDDRISIPDLTFSNAPCHRPLHRMIIRYDGEMCNCCEDTQGDFKLGNVYQNNLEELWRSERHMQVVNDLVIGQREKYDLCRKCPLPPTGPALRGRTTLFRRRNYNIHPGRDL
jgi:radical SAM protein with 4Fe4S-binding SPASM domain